jgi:uncharacterized membrane protein YtjA (UPF0391 family)
MALRGTLILWAIIFLLIAVVAALLGLTWLSGIAQSAALLVVAIFVILFVISFVAGWLRRH